MDSTRILPAFELVSFLHPDNPPGPTRQWNGVVNDDLHLIHTVRGAGIVRLGANTHALVPGVVVFLEPFVEYCVEPDGRAGLEMFNFHFHLSLDHGRSIHRVRSLPTTFQPKPFASIQRRLRQWFGRWQQAAPLERGQVAAGLHALAVGYWQKYGLETPIVECIDREMELVAQWLCQGQQARYDAQACARAVFLSPSQVNRRFRAAYGTSPKEYWLRHRYLQARSKLGYGSERISVLARELGFEDVNYFSRWFKARSGSSPRAYRGALRKLSVFPV